MFALSPFRLLFGAVVVFFITAFRPAPHSASMSADILRLVNQHRRSIGLRPLEANSYMSSVALEHSRDMLSGRTPFGHDGFRNRVDRIRKKLGPVSLAGENVASGPMSAREVVDGWLHSPGHRRNIEGDFRYTGIGLAFGRDGNIFFTQIFAK
ncbi:CAP domain-containing protein [Puia dinghuensis]|nr:CAP domain-containing protein [Puia dinghuensis]